MRIYPISNFNKINFKSNNTTPPSGKNKPQQTGNKPIPGWARKTMIGTLIFFAVKNDPNVQRFIHPYEPTQEDLDRSEYYQDIQNMRKPKGKCSSFYQLNQLNDIETPKVEKLSKNTYSINFELDKQKIDMRVKLDSNNKDTIQGRIKVNDLKPQTFKAIFSTDDINEFKLLLNDDENNNIILGRNRSGELYQLKNNKKEYLNNKNIERYQKHQEELEERSFWSNVNPTLRKLNLLILMFLVYLEMKQDQYEAKKKELEEELKKKLNNEK